jgi:hypothetical protein
MDGPLASTRKTSTTVSRPALVPSMPEGSFRWIIDYGEGTVNIVGLWIMECRALRRMAPSSAVLPSTSPSADSPRRRHAI